MAEESTEHETKGIDLFEENLFELKCLVKATGIVHSARCEIGRKQLLAFTTSHTDIGIYYLRDIYKSPIIKRIQWFRAPHRTISALCFDPTGSWLLTACKDGTLFVIPVLALVNEITIVDHKWSIKDVTPITIVDLQSSYTRPTALTWWESVTRSSHIGIIGTEDGEVVFINLENGQFIGSTRVTGSIISLNICEDNNLGIVFLLITNKLQQQWRSILEQRSIGCIFPLNKSSAFTARTSGNTEENRNFPTRSRLQGLKQLSVEKLAGLKQKLAESRNRNLSSSVIKQESGSSSGNEELDSLQKKETLVHSDFLPEHVFLTPQYTRQGQHLYTAYCKTTNHITIHGTDISVEPLQTYRMPEVCRDVILTQRLFFVTGPRRKTIWVISCPLSETRVIQGDSTNFNTESLIAKFKLEDSREIIKSIYRSSDYPESLEGDQNLETYEEKLLPSKIDELNVEVPSVDTCIIVTNFAIYKIVLRKPLLEVFIKLALKNNQSDIEKAGRLGLIFGINVRQLFQCAGDIHLTNGRFTEGAALYRLSRCRLLKGVLKTAATGHTEKLLEGLGRCLIQPAVSELTTTMRIHLSNLTVFAFSELVLRASSSEANVIYKDFLSFLSRNNYYDERWVVDVVGQACLWKVLHHLATQRGLFAQVLDICLKTIYNSPSPSSINSKYGLLICISEPSLLQSLLTSQTSARKHATFVLSNLADSQIFLLQRLVKLYDPTNPVFRPLLVRYRARRRTTSHSSQSSQCDSIDSSDVFDETGFLVEEFVETFIFILLTLISKKSSTLRHNPELVGRVNFPDIERRTNFVPNVDFKRRLLSAGYGHVALIRNGNVYTWGNSSQGCLGTGPSISRYGLPQAVTTFKNMEMEVLSVSCGRCHTLAVTNNGIYAWGGSEYGQLGLGRLFQTPNPELIVSLAEEVIVDAVAGQYHSVALTMDGRVFTWGWGVHGQLGHGTTYDKNVPTLVNPLLGFVIRIITAGHAHTLCLSSEGSLFAFGCNIFGQLGTGDNIKSTIPVKINLIPEPIADIATSYFHNLALATSNKLYTWGSSPQILRYQSQAQKKLRMLEFQAAAEKYAESLDQFDSAGVNFDGEESGNNERFSEIERLAIDSVNKRKSNCTNELQPASLKDVNLGLLEENQTHLKPSLVDTSLVSGRIIQVSTGCHHSALLSKDGTVYTWGRNVNGQIGNGTRQDIEIPTPLTYNPASVLSQVSPRNQNHQEPENKNGNTKKDQMNRVIKTVRVCCGCEFTVAIQPGGTVIAWGSNRFAQLGRSPTKDSGSVAEKLLLIKSSKRLVRLPHGKHAALDSPCQVPNIPTPIITYQSYDVTPLAGRVRPLSLIDNNYSDVTLHYVLEQFNGLYETSKIMDKCDELGNYQARSKLALLEQNFSISLAYQLKTLNPENYKTFSTSSKDDKELIEEKVKENTKLFAKQIERNLVDSLEETECKKRIKMSSSKSLDCIQLFEQELYHFDCQGGSEELCEDNRSEDNISLDLTEGALENDAEIEDPDWAVSHRRDQNHQKHNHIEKEELKPLDPMMKDALNVVKFYINEIEENSHKVFRQILQTIFSFWVENRLDMEHLENLFLKHINKLYYPLGLILFCNEIGQDRNSNPRVINTVSAKFSLQISSLLLRHIEDGKSSLEYVELLSTLMNQNYGPPLTGHLSPMENKTAEQTMEDIVNTLSSKSSDPRPFIHIKDPEAVSQFLESEDETIVFTCGHHFSMAIYESEVVPNMEAELLVAQPLPLPCTAQVLGNMLSRVCKTEILCPRCAPKVIQNSAKTVLEK